MSFLLPGHKNLLPAHLTTHVRLIIPARHPSVIGISSVSCGTLRLARLTRLHQTIDWGHSGAIGTHWKLKKLLSDNL